MSYEVVYNSDLVLSGNAYLATYCIFYDHVFLPYTSVETVGNMIVCRPGDSSNALIVTEKNLDNMSYRDGDIYRQTGQDIVGWENKYRSLFDEGVLSRLPAPRERIDLQLGLPLNPALENLVQMTRSVIPSEKDDKHLHYRQDVVAHLLRTDVDRPQIFVSKSAQPIREILKACEAESAFTYLLPRLALVQPDQILEVRRKVADTREGFNLHLQSLSEGIEAKLRGGEGLEDIRLFAQSMLETKLIPGYREYVRQLRAEKTGFWGKILASTSEALQIDAAPWTPKFYGDLMKLFGLTFISSDADRKARLSNESQAYQFMHKTEKHLRQLS